MADPSRYPDSSGDTRNEAAAGPEQESITGTPRWVKVFGTILLAVVLLFIILMFTRGPGGRGHTPFRHFGGNAPPDGRNP